MAHNLDVLDRYRAGRTVSLNDVLEWRSRRGNRLVGCEVVNDGLSLSVIIERADRSRFVRELALAEVLKADG